MKKQLKHIVFAITIVWNFFHDSCHAQTSQIDSLKISLSQAKNDSLKCQTLGELGASYYYHGNLSEALSSYENALSLSKTLHYKQGIANSYSGIGMVKEAQGNYDDAIQNMYASLKIMEELGDQHHIVSTYVNMALVLADHGDFEQALKNANFAIDVSKKSGDNMYLGYAYNTLGVVYYYQQKYEEALAQHFLALKVRLALEDKNALSDSYTNIGIIYYELGIAANTNSQSDSAKMYFNFALKNLEESRSIAEETGSVSGIAGVNINIGSLYTQLKNYIEAKKYLQKGLELYQKIGSKEGMKEAYNGLSEVYSLSGNNKEALKYYKLYITYRDSLNNDENAKKITQTQMQYEFDKKEAATKLKQEKKEAVAQAERKRQTIIIWSISGILLLVIGFGVYVYRSYKDKQKANEAITKQKEVIEEKQKEILDSIHYAKRIQTALITSEKYIDRNLNKLNKS